ncbi:hypothetical protein BDW69DRAFT_158355 [Aspergillus filifer]
MKRLKKTISKTDRGLVAGISWGWGLGFVAIPTMTSLRTNGLGRSAWRELKTSHPGMAYLVVPRVKYARSHTTQHSQAV